ncbi:MAG: ComEC/Rec2 family competence protein [Acidimicrobiales bacterium]
MSETQLFAMVVVIWLGATIDQPVPGAIGVALVVAAFIVRRPILLIAAAFVLSLGVSARADRAYHPMTAGSIDTLARLTTDPEPGSFGSTAEAKLASGERVRLSFSLDSRLSGLEAGDPIHVTGSVRPVTDAPWLRVRHLVGIVTVEEFGRRGDSPWWMRPSSVLRSWVAGGASTLAPDDAALYTGLVIGDDRFQSQAQQVLFRVGGLTHLLAVSGQNVAFALAVVAPLLGRLGVRGRLVATVGVLIVFSMATRFEPSVMRATTTAAIAAWSVASGTKASGYGPCAWQCLVWC